MEKQFDVDISKSIEKINFGLHNKSINDLEESKRIRAKNIKLTCDAINYCLNNKTDYLIENPKFNIIYEYNLSDDMITEIINKYKENGIILSFTKHSFMCGSGNFHSINYYIEYIGQKFYLYRDKLSCFANTEKNKDIKSYIDSCNNMCLIFKIFFYAEYMKMYFKNYNYIEFKILQ